jgi:hypothetical protein
MGVHTVREFGWSGLWDPTTGMIPVVGVQLLLLLGWWLRPDARRAAAIALLATAIFQLVGGAILSVLPLPILPFQPEQSLHHYLSHAILGAAQVPLIVVPLRGLAARPTLRYS